MPDKLLNQIPPDLRRLYTRAGEAAQRENPDYAMTLFCQILEKEPGFFDCRRALRLEQAKKAAGQTTGFFKKAFSGVGSSPQIAKAKMALNKNPAEAMAIAEQVLNADPNNSMAHRVIVDAAQALEFPKTAVMSLEVMVRNSPKDKALVVEFADLAAQTGGEASASAERALDELVRASGFDPDLAQAQKNLSARKTMDEGGYSGLADGSGSFRDILKNKEESVSLEQANRVQKSEDVGAKLIKEYEARLPGSRAGQREDDPLAGGSLRGKETVRRRAGHVHAHQELHAWQRRLGAGPRHRRYEAQKNGRRTGAVKSVCHGQCGPDCQT